MNLNCMNKTSDLMDRLATNLKRLRKEAKLNQSECAALGGFHRSHISRIEGGIENIQIDTIERIACAFGMAGYELLTNSDKKPGPPSEYLDIRDSLAQNIQRLRGEKSWSKRDLAAHCSLVQKAYISFIERGKTHLRLSYLVDLANAFGVEAHELLIRCQTLGEATEPLHAGANLKRREPSRAMLTVGANLKKLREGVRLSQKHIARCYGASYAYVAAAEEGKVDLSISDLEHFAGLYRRSAYELLMPTMEQLVSNPRACEPRQCLAENLKQLREANQWDQAELVARVNMSLDEISDMETEAISIAVSQLEELAEAFGVQAHELLLPAQNRARYASWPSRAAVP